MRNLFLLLLGLIATLLLVYAGVAQVSARETAVVPRIDLPENPVPSCRYGVNNLPSLSSDRWIPALGAGFYLNFTAEPRSNDVSPAAEFVPQIRIRQDVETIRAENGKIIPIFKPTYTVTPPLNFSQDEEEPGLGTLVLNNPGQLWLLGNEPDVDNSIQDRTYPEVYARAYHEVYHFIKRLDPTAYVANAGLSMATPARLQYLDIMWDTYQQLYGEPMPVDVWNFHLYILAEKDPNKKFDEEHPTLSDLYADGKIALGTDPNLAILAPLGGVPIETECAREDVYCRAEHDSLTIFTEQIRAMRHWMKDNGQQNKPLILSEWSILYPFLDYDDPVNPTQCFLQDELGGCFTPQRVSTYMLRTLNYMLSAQDVDLGYPGDDYRLVQQWKWYSVYTKPESTGGASSLVVEDYRDYEPGDPAALTLAGEVFRESVSIQRTTVNLVGGAPASHVNFVNQPDGTAVATISANFYNSGTTGVDVPFSVTFYADKELTEVIGTLEVTEGVVNGCAWGRSTDRATITWEGLTPGTHRYWAKIDSANDIDIETDEDDNLTSGTLRIYPRIGSYIPLVHR